MQYDLLGIRCFGKITSIPFHRGTRPTIFQAPKPVVDWLVVSGRVVDVNLSRDGLPCAGVRDTPVVKWRPALPVRWGRPESSEPRANGRDGKGRDRARYGADEQRKYLFCGLNARSNIICVIKSNFKVNFSPAAVHARVSVCINYR